MSIALITGITGQDGSYLAEFLLKKDYQVHGVVRRSSNTVRTRIDHLTQDSEVYGKRLFLHYADLDDVTTIRRLLAKIEPSEIYHLAGQTHVGASFDIPESTCQFAAMGTLRLLEIVRDCQPVPRFLHISSSEIFGAPDYAPQDEVCPFRPSTPYGVAKAFATNMVRVYRESFGLYVCNAICFNHESPRRGESFVTRKITRAAARIKSGLETSLPLGSIDARRDWGFAPDFVRGFWAMLQMQEACDLVLGTGRQHQVRDWLDVAFEHVNLDWRDYVVEDPRFLRKADPNKLVADTRLARQRIDWMPTLTFREMVGEMVDADLKDCKKA